MTKLQGVRSGRGFMSLLSDSLKQFDISYSGSGAVYLNMKDSTMPKMWENFIWYVSSITGMADDFDAVLDKELTLYKAFYRFVEDRNGHIKKDYVHFATEADFTMFVMKWS